MNSYNLSFCIPTYNRVQSVQRLVKDILSCPDPDIEVVVLDNGSTDDTLSVLREIKDERLFVYSNGVNRGALYNMVNVLNRGRGAYLVYSTDQDYVDHSKISKFKSFLLRHPDLACGYCRFDSRSENEFELFPKGYQSINNIAYRERHPTGYFFNNKLIKTVSLVERFSDYDFVDLFPLEFVFAELCLMGNGAIYHGNIFKPETGRNVVKHKSSTTNGKSSKAFFSPEARLKLAINYSKHIDTLQLGQHEKTLLAIDTFIDGLLSTTLGYKAILGNTDLCIHYYMEPRVIKTKELFDIGLNYYKQYVAQVINMSGARCLKQIVFTTRVLFRFIRKMIIKYVKPIK